MSVALRYVYEDRDRHGNVRVYFWRGKGYPKVRIKEAPGTAAFGEAYERLLGNDTAAEPEINDPLSPPVPGTWRWLCVEYFKSAAFKELDAQTQRPRKRVLENTFDEKVSPASSRVFADVPIPRFGVDAVMVLRDRKASAPEAGNARVKGIRAVFKWALARKPKIPGVTGNPGRDVPLFKGSEEGFHTWTPDEVKRFEDRHPIGSKARLAFALYLYTGVRKSDVVLLGRHHVREGWFKFTTFKGRKRKPVTVEIPVLPELQRIIEATSCIGVRTFLVTEHGKPFTANGFGNKMRTWCDEAGLPECTSHGIRKAAAATAAENGATVNQLMAIFGWLTEQQAILYTKKARRKKLAAGATELLGKHRT